MPNLGIKMNCLAVNPTEMLVLMLQDLESNLSKEISTRLYWVVLQEIDSSAFTDCALKTKLKKYHEIWETVSSDTYTTIFRFSDNTTPEEHIPSVSEITEARNNVSQKIKSIICNYFDLSSEELEEFLDSSLKVGNIDSLDMVGLSFDIEDHFGIQVNDEQVFQCKTISDWVALVTQIINGAEVKSDVKIELDGINEDKNLDE
jgi:acyl carrier protein